MRSLLPRRLGRRKARLAAAPAALLAVLLALGWLLAPGAGAGLSAGPTATATAAAFPITSYELARRAPVNRPEHYPLERRPDPSLYRPHATWMGRLILPAATDPSPTEAGARDDWTWIELEQAPPDHADLVGRRLRLSWRNRPALQRLVEAVATDVTLGEEATAARRAGNLVPLRLDGRRAVGPLQSLAGARLHDDVTVELEDVAVGTDRSDPLLRIGRVPVQISGRWTGLVRILGPAAAREGPDRFRVRHYRSESGRFDGPLETVHIPRQPPDRFGRRFFDPQNLQRSPDGQEGWYLHGSPDAEGTFTVQALEPRRLGQLVADREIHGTQAALHHVQQGNWRDTPRQRGRITRVALWPDRARRTLLSGRETATGRWRIGDEALVIHAFGGIGGPGGEPTPGFTVTGHFAFGQARLVRDPFTSQPRFRIRYHQIYANNPNGIVAGSQDWSAFAGDLQRGWLATRPISDLLVEGDGPLLRNLGVQAEVLAARYRSGDGSGVSTVTPATSCVQDSSQALFISLDQLRQAAPSADADGDRHQRLSSLGDDLEGLLTPFGIVRPDWQHNAARVAAARGNGPAAGGFDRSGGWRGALMSWRSMLPRRAHDDLAKVFLRHGAPVWILRTNQIPGNDPSLEPLAPTLVLGQIPWASTLLRRLGDALFTPLRPAGLALVMLLLAGYAVVVLPPGLRSGFLEPHPPRSLLRLLGGAAALLPMPALGEELLFRVALLPHPLEGAGTAANLGWGAVSVAAFVIYHPLAARFWYPPGRGLFGQARFLVPCTLLGVICVIAYQVTGSLWPPLLLHWVVVVAWLEFLGGRRLLRSPRSTAQG